MTSTIAVLGAGAWGLTLAELLASKGPTVRVWDPDTPRLQAIAKSRVPGKPPDLRLPESVVLTENFGACLRGAGAIVVVVPSFAVREACGQIRESGVSLDSVLLVNCAKGIEEETLCLPSQIFMEEFGDGIADSYAVLSGPSHAEEVCRRIPTTVVSASRNLAAAEKVRDLFMLPEFRVYTQTDVTGVELGAAVKNVIAIAAGACDGLGFGDNTKAALITRGLAEISRAGAELKANPTTLAGLAGLGDLVVTACSRHSRNRQFGELLAAGHSPEAALKLVGAVVEGFRTSRSVHQLAKRLGIAMPISDAVYRVCHGGLAVKDAMAGLLGREPRPEVY